MTGHLEGRTVLVTGGSRGLGRAMVELLVADGARVAFTWSSDAGGADDVAQSGATAMQLDLRDRAAPAALVRAVESELGPLDGLVNNAGVHASGLMAMTSDASWDEMLDINLGGAFRMTRAVVPGMVSRRSGSIVNVSSLVAVAGLAGESAYAASKAGLLGMTRSLARELGSRSIRVNAVLPGFVATDMTSGLAPASKALETRHVLKGGVTPVDVAGMVAFLLSDRARAVTGQALIVDAGLSA